MKCIVYNEICINNFVEVKCWCLLHIFLELYTDVCNVIDILMNHKLSLVIFIMFMINHAYSPRVVDSTVLRMLTPIHPMIHNKRKKEPFMYGKKGIFELHWMTHYLATVSRQKQMYSVVIIMSNQREMLILLR